VSYKVRGDDRIINVPCLVDMIIGAMVGSGNVDVSHARTQAGRLPSSPGVYRFRDSSGRVLYLGRAMSLRRRVPSYWGDLRGRRHLADMVAHIVQVEAVASDSAHEAAWLERNLLRRSLPPWNRSPDGGQEVEVWIRLSDSPRTPGLDVVHHRLPGDQARYFGPYLGGRKVRDAVSGLSRVLPLAYTADVRAGAVRDLARLRGASPASRAGLTRSVAAVLDRDPAAAALVRAELASRRDAAAARLSFEFAAKLQAEIEALDWVTTEQKVTRQEPTAFDVCGWADGILVEFEIRGGRLSGWNQRQCAEEATRRRCSETPPEWTAFAIRNALLAAKLAR
jgi:excinuclease ABC subunit C